MSSSSESEEFFDAEDATPNRTSSGSVGAIAPVSVSASASNFASSGVARGARSPAIARTGSEPNVSRPGAPPATTSSLDNIAEAGGNAEAPRPADAARGRKRFQELRQRMQTDDEDAPAGTASPPDSQTSSVEGVYAAMGKISHPFRIIEHDTLSLQSISSLGRVGRILGGLVESAGGGTGRDVQSVATSLSTLSSSSRDSESTPSSKDIPPQPVPLVAKTQSAESLGREARAPLLLPLQEPDVIASTKSSSVTHSTLVDQPARAAAPVAPPRRKKKDKAAAMNTAAGGTSRPQPLPAVPAQTEAGAPALASPASTIESLTREFEHSLDCGRPGRRELELRDATKGQYVVKPQDEDRARAEGAAPAGQRRPEPRHRVSASSLGPHVVGRAAPGTRSAKDRRRSAGDENLIEQLNMFVRTRTDSGKKLSDLEILEQVMVLNLDTGEKVPLSIAEDKLPQCINPLSLQIMRLTSEYVSHAAAADKDKESDDESVGSSSRRSAAALDDADADADGDADPDTDADAGRGVRKRTAKLKRFLGSTVKRTMDKAKSIAQEVSHARHKEDVLELVDEVHPGEHSVKLKASHSHKGPYELESIQHVQELSEHAGPIWCMKFSSCGRLLATAGQDKVLRVWVVRDAHQFFQDMRTKYNAEKVSPTPSQESLVSHHSADDAAAAAAGAEPAEPPRPGCIFAPRPFCTYAGHTADLLDVSWSKNYFLLSSSMDKTVRLWHISRKECLCCFQHIDFVTAIVFHPRDDRYFLSGSLDGKLRLWNIPDKKVAVWNEVEGQTKLITAANFCQNGKFAVVGSYDGRCIFYITDQLKYHTQIHVRSTRGKNSTGRKISGIEPMPGEDKILVTSNDSRVRLYDLCDLSLSCKYKGYVNVSSQIRASFSHDGKYIVSGSENRDVYVWKTHHDYSKFSSVRRDRNDFWEAVKAHSAVVTCAVFAPNPDGIIRMVDELAAAQAGERPPPDPPGRPQDPMVEQRTKGCGGYVLVSADFNGCIKVFINRMKPKHSSLPASALA